MSRLGCARRCARVRSELSDVIRQKELGGQQAVTFDPCQHHTPSWHLYRSRQTRLGCSGAVRAAHELRLPVIKGDQTSAPVSTTARLAQPCMAPFLTRSRFAMFQVTSNLQRINYYRFRIAHPPLSLTQY